LELEFVPGGSLDKHIDIQSMCTINPDAAQSIWLGISEGLEYIHARGIMHCDVKPENILIRADSERAVLCDFGNAVTNLTLRGGEALFGYAVTNPTVKGGGTPCYVPPEGLYGEWSYGGDIWALGVTMLYATGRMPLPNRSWIIANIHTDVNAASEMRDWLLNVAEIAGKVPKQLNMLRKMLGEDPRNRIVAKDLVQGLRSMERGKRLKGSETVKILL